MQNLVPDGKVPKYLGLFADGMFGIGDFQAKNFNMKTLRFDGPDVISFATKQDAKNWFRDRITEGGSERMSMELHLIDPEEIGIHPDSEPIEKYYVSFRRALEVW